ncbi:two pore channel protein 2 isoform X3 [Hydra vulgaris]|uniref:Two pore channel protein 2 isoform X3 n=1 Tax=Hydra vulgaris TaxID=6087 RepID=A0ABM4D7I9_HYDVU
MFLKELLRRKNVNDKESDHWKKNSWGESYGSLNLSTNMVSETDSDVVPIVPYSPSYSMDMSVNLSSSKESSDETRFSRAHLQAVVFVEDAIEHRSIHHKVDPISLYRYRLYHSKHIQRLFRFTITLLLILPFFETPSSLTWSSDPRKRGNRYTFPCGITESIELICFIIMSISFISKFVIIGKRHAKSNYWLIAFGLVLIFSYVDWFVSLGHICNEKWRIRRLLRPFFLIQNSSLMKKTVNSIKRSIPHILSVLFLLALHLYFFTMFGMVLFAPEDFSKQAVIHSVNASSNKDSLDMLNNRNEGKAYFFDLGAAIMTLTILLTTANNPDVMMPAYSDNRFYAIFFILFLAVGMYFFMNVLLAVIYNEFKGSFTKTMQSSFIRRRCGIRAAFEVLLGVSYQPSSSETPSCIEVSLVRDILKDIHFSRKLRYMPKLEEFLTKLNTNVINAKQFQELFDIVFSDSIKKRIPCREFHYPLLLKVQSILLHNYFQYFGDFVCALNAFVVTVELATSIEVTFSGDRLSILNFCFISYFAIEQVLMIYFIGAKRYFSHKTVWFDSVITWALVLVEITFISLYGGPIPYMTKEEIVIRSNNLKFLSVYNLLRITNMLIIVRILRIIPSIKPLSVVARAMVDLAKNLKSFAGIVIVIYYVFALIGMMIFQDKSPRPTLVNATLNTYRITNPNITCGYEQLDYYANNFDDFAASLVVLWDVMVVNNWYVFLNAYSTSMKNRYTQFYFVLWWLTSVVICINLFVALVIEAFITQWDQHQEIVNEKKHKKRKYAQNEETSRHFRVHEWFRATYKEPTEKEILQEIYSHKYLRRYTLLNSRDFQE